MKKTLLYTIIFASSAFLNTFCAHPKACAAEIAAAAASAASNSAPSAAAPTAPVVRKITKKEASAQAENEYHQAYEALVSKIDPNNWNEPELPTLASLKKLNIPHLSDEVIRDVYGMFATTKAEMAHDLPLIEKQLNEAEKNTYDNPNYAFLERNLVAAQGNQKFAFMASVLSRKAPKERSAWIKQRAADILSGK